MADIASATALDAALFEMVLEIDVPILKYMDPVHDDDFLMT